MEQSQTTVKKVYNQYTNSDFVYGTQDSTNLNPKREITLDNLDKIVLKLQEVTDDIIRKKIVPAEPEEPPEEANFGTDAPAQGIPLQKQIVIAKTGGMGNALIFPVVEVGVKVTGIEKSLEYMIGTFPVGRLLDVLDEPPILDCEEILLQFTGKKENPRLDGSDSEDEEVSGSLESYYADQMGYETEDGDGDSDDDEDEESDNEDEDDDEDDDRTDDEKECATIELTWLKIILIILKILKILKMIIDFILSILVPIITIVMWAVGAWINPPNIAMIIQFIIEIVTALIVMIIAWLLQMLWNLLNLDCIGDMTADLLRQIQEAISMFASIAGAFNPVHINLLVDKFKAVTDPLQALMDTAKNKKEQWKKFTDQIKNTDGQLTTQLKKAEKNLANSIQNGLSNNAQVAQVRGIVNQTMSIKNDVMKAMKDIKKAYSAANIAASFSAAKGQFTAMLSSPNIELDEMTKVEK